MPPAVPEGEDWICVWNSCREGGIFHLNLECRSSNTSEAGALSFNGALMASQTFLIRCGGIPVDAVIERK
jgi:hypothetical protein